jgi:hypothetical protein
MAAAAALAALLLPLTACSGSSGGNLTTVVSSGAPTTAGKVPAASSSTPTVAGATTAAPAATTAAPAAAPAGPAPADAPTILAKAVEGLRAGYQVDSAVAAENLILTNLTGRVVGPSSLLSVTSGSATVEYLQVPPQVWVREPGGDWKAADTESTPKDTLAPLSAPTALAFESADTDGQHLKATYDGPSLGMAENPTVDAELVVGPDGAITVRYAATAQGKPLNVLTRLAPSDPTPIVAPA